MDLLQSLAEICFNKNKASHGTRGQRGTISALGEINKDWFYT